MTPRTQHERGARGQGARRRAIECRYCRAHEQSVDGDVTDTGDVRTIRRRGRTMTQHLLACERCRREWWSLRSPHVEREREALRASPVARALSQLLSPVTPTHKPT